MRLLIPILALISISGVAIACGTEAVKPDSSPTSVPCPARPSSTASASDPQTVRGPFSTECVREYFGPTLVIPSLEPRLNRLGVGFDVIPSPVELDVYYGEPGSKEVKVWMEILTHRPPSFQPGAEPVLTPKGRSIQVQAEEHELVGYWDAGDLNFRAQIIGSTGDSARELLSTVADVSIDQTTR